MGENDGKPPHRDRGPEQNGNAADGSRGSSWDADEWDADNWELIEGAEGPEKTPRRRKRHNRSAPPVTRMEPSPVTGIDDLDDLSWAVESEEDHTALYSPDEVNAALEQDPVWEDSLGEPPSGEQAFPRERTDPMAQADFQSVFGDVQDIDVSEVAQLSSDDAVDRSKLVDGLQEAAGSWQLDEGEDTAPTMSAWQREGPQKQRRDQPLEERDTSLFSSSEVKVVEEGSADEITNEKIISEQAADQPSGHRKNQVGTSGEWSEHASSGVPLPPADHPKTPVVDSADIVLGSDDLAALVGESDEELIADENSSGASEVIEPWALTGMHVVEELARPATDLPPLLDEITQLVGDGKSLPRYTRRLVSELIQELRTNTPQDPVHLASYTHELADALRRTLPAGEQHLPRRLDEIAITVAPAYLPAHHALLAQSLKIGDWGVYSERLERFAEQLNALSERHVSIQTSLSSVLVELALLLEFKLDGREDSQRTLANRALRAADGYLLPAINFLRLALSRGEGQNAAAAYRQIAALTSMPIQAAVNFDLAVFLWTELNEQAQAVDVAHQLQSLRGEQLSVYPLQLLAWQTRDRELELSISRARIARVVSEGKEIGHRLPQRRRRLKLRAAGMFHRLHELYLESRELDRAEKALHDALQVAPGGMLHIERVIAMARERSDWPLVDEMLGRLFELTESPDRRAALAHARARLHLEHLSDRSGARERLLEALEANPGYVPGAIELGRMFLQEQQYEPLFELWQSLATDPEDEEDESGEGRWFDDLGAYRRGDIQENLLARHGDAFESYLQAFGDNLDDYVVACAIERTGFLTARFREVAEAFLQAADMTDDRLRQSDLCWKAAQLMDRELDDIDGAIQAYLRFLQVDPTHLPALKAVIRLYRRGGYLNEATDVLEQVINLEENDSESRILREWLGYLASRMGDAERAKRVLDALIEDAPTSVTAQSLLRSSLLRARDWDGLEAFCVKLSESVDDSRRRDLLLQAALVSRSQLNDNSRARRHLEAARGIDPAWAPVLDLLEEVYGEEGDDAALLELLVDRAAFAPDTERGRLLEQAASLCVDGLGDQERAESLYLEAHDYLPEDPAIWRGLTGLLRGRESWPELVALIETRLERSLDRATRLALLRELGFIRSELTLDYDDAIRAYRAILDIAPDHVVALHGLVRLYDRLEDSMGLAEIHGRIADAVVDVDDRIYHLMEQIHFETEAQGRVPFARLERVLGIAPGHPGVLRYLRAHKLTREDRPRLIALLTGRPPARHDLQNAFDLYELGNLHEEAERLEEARELYERVAGMRPQFLPVHIALARVLDALGDINTAAQHCARIADQVSEARFRLPLLRAAADRFQRAAKRQEAAEMHELILTLDPDDPEAFDALREHYQQTGDVDRLSALLASRTEAESPEARIAMLREIAQLHTVEGGSDTYREALEELVERVPDDVDARRRLARLEEAEGRYARAAQRWEGVVDLLEEGDEARKTRLHVAEIWRDRCDMPQRAIDHYTVLLREDRDDYVSLEGMARSLADKGEIQPAITCYRRLFKNLESTESRVRIGLALGGLYRDEVGDRQEAARWYVAVGELDAGCEAATEALIALGTPDRRGEAAGRATAMEGQGAPATSEAGGLSSEQLNKAIRVQLDALSEHPWAMGRYEQLAQLMRLRDQGDVRVGLLASLLHEIGRTSHDIDRSLAYHKRRFSSPRGPLSERDYNMVLHPWSRGAHYDLFARLGEAFGKVVGPDRNRFHVEDEDIVGLSEPLARVCDDICKAIGIVTPTLYYHPSKDRAVGVAMSPETSLIAGMELWQDEEVLPVHRFRLSRALESVRDAKAVALSVSASELEGLLAAAINALFPDLSLPYSPPQPTAGTGRHLDVRTVGSRVAKSLPRRKRRELRQLAERAASTQWDVDQWRSGLEATLLRSALLVCPDLGAAARALSSRFSGPLHEDELQGLLAEEGHFQRLLHFALSEDAATLIQRLYP